MPGSLSSEEFIDFYIKCAEVLEDIRVERNFGFEEKLSDDKISIEFQEFLYRVVEKYNYPKKIFILESYLKLISIVISWLSINNLLLVLSFFFSLKKK